MHSGQVRSESTMHPTAARSPGLNFFTAEPDLCHAADNLVTGHARIYGRHHAAPLVARLVKIGVADAAEQNLDLHVVSRWDRAARSWWKQAAMSHWTAYALALYIDFFSFSCKLYRRYAIRFARF